jgi:hypothetical protein
VLLSNSAAGPGGRANLIGPVPPGWPYFFLSHPLETCNPGLRYIRRPGSPTGLRRGQTKEDVNSILRALVVTGVRRKEVVRPAGFEPATCGFEGRRSIQLSYGRVMERLDAKAKPGGL